MNNVRWSPTSFKMSFKTSFILWREWHPINMPWVNTHGLIQLRHVVFGGHTSCTAAASWNIDGANASTDATSIFHKIPNKAKSRASCKFGLHISRGFKLVFSLGVNHKSIPLYALPSSLGLINTPLYFFCECDTSLDQELTPLLMVSPCECNTIVYLELAPFQRVSQRWVLQLADYWNGQIQINNHQCAMPKKSSKATTHMLYSLHILDWNFIKFTILIGLD